MHSSCWGDDNSLPVQRARSALMSSGLAITHRSECVGAWLFACGVRNETAASLSNAYIKWMKKHLQILISLNTMWLSSTFISSIQFNSNKWICTQTLPWGGSALGSPGSPGDERANGPHLLSGVKTVQWQEGDKGSLRSGGKHLKLTVAVRFCRVGSSGTTR